LLKEKKQKNSIESIVNFRNLRTWHTTILLNQDTTGKAAFSVSEAVLSAPHTDKDSIDQT
jgi:hypothetical protein